MTQTLVFDDPRYVGYLILLFGLVFFIFLLSFRKVCFFNVRRIQWALKISLLYMALPCVLFILSLPMGVLAKAILIALALYSFIRAFRGLSKRGLFHEEDQYVLRVDFLFLAVGLLVVAYAPMFWGEGYLADWFYHRGKLLCLYHHPFAPVLDGFNLPPEFPWGESRFVYYYNMYLPAVYAMKILNGLPWIHFSGDLSGLLSIFFACWNLSGLLLGFLLAPVFCRKVFGEQSAVFWGSFFLVLIFFGGADYWYQWFFKKQFFLSHAEWGNPLVRHQGYFVQFSSFMTLWQWVPNQLVSGFLVLMLLGMYAGQALERFPFALGSLFLLSGSTWCWIGILPFFLFLLIRSGALERSRWGEWARSKGELAAFLVLSAVTGLFLMDKVESDGFGLNPRLSQMNGWICYLGFFLIEMLVVGIVLAYSFLRRRKVSSAVLFSLSVLFILPAFRSYSPSGLETFNNFAMRASIPTLLVLMMFCALTIQGVFQERARTGLLAALLFFSITAPLFLNEFIGGLATKSPQVPLFGVKFFVGTSDPWAKWFTFLEKREG